MSWVSMSDTMIMQSSQQVRATIGQTCPPGAHSDTSEIQAAITSQPTVESCDKVENATLSNIGNIFSFTNTVYAYITPVDGAEVGELRGNLFLAMTQVNDAKMIGCRSFAVDLIEYDDGKGILAAAVGSGPSITSSVSLVAVAILAVVGLILWKTR